ncbi:MAG: hypothetical protein AB7N24_02175 [Dehalococcoidia bacterium]
MDPATLDWLMEGDPAIRWQVLRDLKDASESTWRVEQAKVAMEGWGAELLAQQDPDGRWGGGWYSPKWTSLFYTMQLLWLLGVPAGTPQAERGASLIVDWGLCGDGGLKLGPRPHPRLSETCETGMGLASIARFEAGAREGATIAANLLREQMADGGWNCQRRSGATHASFHTTICALEGLLEWELERGSDRETTAARQRGEEFLLRHQLFRSHRTGEVVDKKYLMLSFPGRWHYDVLRALDYLAAAGAVRDHRAAEAIEAVRAKQRADGTWPLQMRHTGRTFFEMEHPGKPSRWNTLRVLRVLRWWEA